MDRISVRKLVEFILRNGDINAGTRTSTDAKAMEEGTRVHKKIQKMGGASYESEVPLKFLYTSLEGIKVEVEGRADGIIREDAAVCIDEIKGTYSDVFLISEPELLHAAQAYVYAFIVATQEQMETIDVQITYANMDTMDIKRFRETKTREDLYFWFTDLMEQYVQWVKWQQEWQEERDISIASLEFPFEYRAGQRKLVAAAYHVMKEKKKLFALAPTGTGKTIASLFPAIKIMGQGESSKIFYLTAKNITGKVAGDTFELLKDRGLKFKYVKITAKDRICILEEPNCDPSVCERAQGHFDRVNDALFDIISHEDLIDEAVILRYAKKHMVCPFELQLDVSLFTDGVICDYNYAFDPRVYLKRFFQGGKDDYIFLIDEAHNLIDRAREMYSADIYSAHYEELSMLLERHKGLSTVRKVLGLINQIMNEFDRLDMGPELTLIPDCEGFPVLFLRLLAAFDDVLKEDLPESIKKSILDVYFESRTFSDVYMNMDERYLVYTCEHDGARMIKILCVDPSEDISERTDKGRAAVFFSATLIPVRYYKELLSTSHETDMDIYIPSPFDPEKKLIVMASDVSSMYKRRNIFEYEKICSYISDIISSKPGNYMIYFPSYEFLENVYDVFMRDLPDLKDVKLKVVKQEAGMNNLRREGFLNIFTEESEDCIVGFCVIGGVFSEGIDLKNDSLIGSIIVGTGLPGISSETDLIMNWFKEKGMNGFDHAYRFPGFNKVLQAGGRVIRTTEDTGVIALLDDRFLRNDYVNMFPVEWKNRVVVSMEDVRATVDNFWKNH